MLYIALIFVIFLAGCIDNGRTKTEIISKDMLTIKSIDILPSKDLQPDDTVIIRMEVENVGQDSTYLLLDKNTNVISNTNPDWNGDYLLIDHCPSLYNANSNTEVKDADFQILSGGVCEDLTSSIPLVRDSNGTEIGGSACYLRIPSGQSHTFQWSMKAPSSDKIADMTHKCTFKFQIAYASKAITNTYVYFADPIEVAQRIYTKKEMSLSGDNIASYGPVAVNFAPAEPQPIPARSGEPWTVFLNLRNVGAGIANVNDLSLFTPVADGVLPVNCIWIGGIKNINKQLAILYTVSSFGYAPPVPGQTITVKEELIKAKEACEKKSIHSCTSQSDIDAICSEDPGFCSAQFPEIIKTLEDAENKLKIYAGTSSRLPCELTIPTGVTILTPFRFVTSADYTYSIRQDISITTKPVKERV